jgi:hypothetical protein
MIFRRGLRREISLNAGFRSTWWKPSPRICALLRFAAGRDEKSERGHHRQRRIAFDALSHLLSLAACRRMSMIESNSANSLTPCGRPKVFSHY